MRSCLIAALICIVTAFGGKSVGADPTELMSLWESPGKVDLADSWPPGLRIVIYDDGQVIKVVRAASSAGQTQVVTGYVSPEGAKRRAAATVAALSDAPRPEYIKADFQERRWTVLQVWDAARNDHVKWSVVGHPCARLEGSEPNLLDEQVRAALDERFRTACDMLANTMIEDPADWSPQIMRIDLVRIEDAAGTAEPWPPDWPEEGRYAGRLIVCLNRQTATEDLTRKLTSLDVSAQQAALDTPVRSPDGKIWRVKGVRYALPSTIAHISRDGDNIGAMLVASGPCRKR